ncbi:MAG: hypothetical protein GXY58_10110 [Planctomycetaceae bacterium]|nr:hypothetical protein [Planctomycetaceae bacterium]
MPESAVARTCAGSPRRELRRLLGFLALVLVVRLVHVLLLGTPLTGMNPKMAVLAKDWIQLGWGTAQLGVPPGPVCLLAALSGLLGLPPGSLIPLVLIIAHLCLAAGFWYWLKSLQLDDELAVTSLLLCTFLPAHNSYVGLDNYPVVFAAAAFFGALAIWHASLRRALSWPSLLGLAVLAAAIGTFRGEYVLFLPLYFAFFAGCHAIQRGVWPPRTAWVPACIMLVAVVAGTCTASIGRPRQAGLTVVPPQYMCWTFLDGTPPAWQTPSDSSEADRVRRGIEHFGHPADYDYSVPRMIWSHPGQTVAKFVLNLPSWLFELGRRHVVVPLPLALVAAWGAVVLYRRRGRSGAGICWPATLATVLMTVFLPLLIVSARYMLPAFPALCVLGAAGLLALWGGLHRCGFQLTGLRGARWAAMAAVCAGLELLLLRGGGLLRDAPDLRPVAKYVDEQFGRLPRPPLLIDPDSMAIDGACRAMICNRWICQAEGWAQFSVHAKDPLAAALSPEAAALGLDTVVFWVPGDVVTPDGQRRLDQWTQAGYRLQQTYVTPAGALPQYTILTLRAAHAE